MTVGLMGLAEIKVNAASVVDGASIAAYVTDALGTLVTSTLVSGKQSLDVNVTQSALPAGASTEATLASILSLETSESALAGGAYAIGDHGKKSWVAVRSDAGGPLVSATGEYTPLSVDSTGHLRVAGTITDSAAVAILQQAIVVGTTAVKLPSTPLANRINLVVQNSGSKTVYIGSTTVTNSGATRGPYIEKGGFISLDVAASVDVYGIASGAGGEVLILEAA